MTTKTRIDIDRISCSNDLYDAADALLAASLKLKPAPIPTYGNPLATRLAILERAQRICQELARQVLTIGRTDVAEAYADAGRLLAREAIEQLEATS